MNLYHVCRPVAVFFVLGSLAYNVSCTNLRKGQGLDDRERSVFSIYAGQICEIELFKSGVKKSDLTSLDCEQLAKFRQQGQDFCNDPTLTGTASFPGETRKLRLCQNLEPTFETKKSVRFLVFGDAGAGESVSAGELQRTVAAAMTSACPSNLLSPESDSGCDFALVTGDLIYPDGVGNVFDGQFDRKFEEPYQPYGDMPFYMVLGDHDVLGSVKAMQEYTYFSNKWRMLGSHGVVNGLPSWLHIYRTNSMGMSGDDKTNGETASDQLDDVRAHACDPAAKSEDHAKMWNIVFGHHTVAGSGSHGGVAETAEFIRDINSECGVDAYFSGHEHHQEHLVVDMNEADPKFQGTLDLFIQGGGGAELRDIELWPEETRTLAIADESYKYQQRFARKTHGFAVVDATAESLVVNFYEAARDEEPKIIYTCKKTHKSQSCIPSL